MLVGPRDDEILWEEYLFSEPEILAEFQEQCEEAAERNLVLPERLRVAAKAFCRLKRRNP